IVLAVDRLQVLGNRSFAASAPSERIEFVVGRKNRAGVLDTDIAERSAIVVRISAAINAIGVADQPFNVEGARSVFAAFRRTDAGAARDIAAHVDWRLTQKNQSTPVATSALAKGLRTRHDDRPRLRAARVDLPVLCDHQRGRRSRTGLA